MGVLAQVSRALYITIVDKLLASSRPSSSTCLEAAAPIIRPVCSVSAPHILSPLAHVHAAIGVRVYPGAVPLVLSPFPIVRHALAFPHAKKHASSVQNVGPRPDLNEQCGV